MIDISLPLVCDASVVLNLGHRGGLEVLTKRLVGELKITLVVTTEVEKEVSRDDPVFYRKFLSAYFQIDRDPLHRIVEVEQAAFPKVIGSGEKSTLSLSLHNGWQACIDETIGRSVANKLEIPFFGTFGILKLGITNNFLSDEEAATTVQQLRMRGFYCPKIPLNETFSEYFNRFGGV